MKILGKRLYCLKCFIGIFNVWLFFLVLVCATTDWTWGLAQTRPVLYQWTTYAPNPGSDQLASKIDSCVLPSLSLLWFAIWLQCEKRFASRRTAGKGRVSDQSTQLQILHLDSLPKCDKCCFLKGLLRSGIWNQWLWSACLRPFHTSCWNGAFHALVLSNETFRGDWWSGKGAGGNHQGLFRSFVVTSHHCGEKSAMNKHCAIGKGLFGHNILKVLAYHLESRCL